jgi:hypothetical protein
LFLIVVRLAQSGFWVHRLSLTLYKLFFVPPFFLLGLLWTCCFRAPLFLLVLKVLIWLLHEVSQMALDFVKKTFFLFTILVVFVCDLIGHFVKVCSGYVMVGLLSVTQVDGFW